MPARRIGTVVAMRVLAHYPMWRAGRARPSTQTTSGRRSCTAPTRWFGSPNNQPPHSVWQATINAFLGFDIMTTQIVVVTPVRNEARILNRFLSVTSQFADLIIVADQNSTNGSRAIYPLFPKVVMVENPSVGFNEAERQLLLLAKARKRVPGRRLILALDADELLAADAVTRPGWQTALNAAPGTVICFEKPDILSPPDRCIRYTRPWPTRVPG